MYAEKAIGLPDINYQSIWGFGGKMEERTETQNEGGHNALAAFGEVTVNGGDLQLTQTANFHQETTNNYIQNGTPPKIKGGTYDSGEWPDNAGVVLESDADAKDRIKASVVSGGISNEQYYQSLTMIEKYGRNNPQVNAVVNALVDKNDPKHDDAVKAVNGFKQWKPGFER